MRGFVFDLSVFELAYTSPPHRIFSLADFANPCMLPTCVSPPYGYKVDTVVTAASSPLGANEANEVVEITVTGTGLAGVQCSDLSFNSNQYGRGGCW